MIRAGQSPSVVSVDGILLVEIGMPNTAMPTMASIAIVMVSRGERMTNRATAANRFTSPSTLPSVNQRRWSRQRSWQNHYQDDDQHDRHQCRYLKRDRVIGATAQYGPSWSPTEGQRVPATFDVPHRVFTSSLTASAKRSRDQCQPGARRQRLSLQNGFVPLVFKRF